MRLGIDILENELVEKYPTIFNTLLIDNTTGKNIIWATNNYNHIGDLYTFHSQILTELISGDYGSVIMPRVHKNKLLQQSRSKEMAEVFTPSWVCNAQNNLIDTSWFGKKNVFNVEKITNNGNATWITKKNKIQFPSNKTWVDYISAVRLEVSCGEAPYITSRYDTTNGNFIPIENRIGILDRKLRIICENVDIKKDWIKYATLAYQSTYAYEWQGDSLLLAREAMLISFIENYIYKFGEEPLPSSIKKISNIISWNVWQMDGLKGVVPNSCKSQFSENSDLFGDTQKKFVECKGCTSNNVMQHNGKYCIIMDWSNNKNKSSIGSIIRFVDLLTNKLV